MFWPFLALFPIPQNSQLLTLGYMQYSIDKYVSWPLCCFTCWRLRHSSISCHSKPACSNCAYPHHTADSCSSLVPRCINCHGMHAWCFHFLRLSLLPCRLVVGLYQKELSICTLQADLSSHLLSRISLLNWGVFPTSPWPTMSNLSPLFF